MPPPPPVDVPDNDLLGLDPTRAVEMEAAIRASVLPHEDIRCSFLLVGFPRELLRVELCGADWCENLPLLSKDVAASTVGTLAAGVIERRRTPRPPGH
jgi:hypothetical protein